MSIKTNTSVRILLFKDGDKVLTFVFLSDATCIILDNAKIVFQMTASALYFPVLYY